MDEVLNYILLEEVSEELTIVAKADGSGEPCVFATKEDAEAALPSTWNTAIVVPFTVGKLESLQAAIRLYNGLTKALPHLTDEQLAVIIDKRLYQLLQRN